MFILFIRTIILYFLVILAVRLMGKRQIGELQPYEFVITIMISDLAMLPMQDVKLPLLVGAIPILTLLLLKLILSQLQLKSQFARRLLDGEPSILIYKSKINYKALKTQQINLDELMEEIRISGFFDLEDIQYAILETNGDLSILPRPSCDKIFLNNDGTPIITRTMSGMDSNNDIFLPKILISDGKINTNSLTRVNKDSSWIKDKLKEYNIFDISTVLIAFFDSKGNFKYQLFDDYDNLRRKDSKNEK